MKTKDGYTVTTIEQDGPWAGEEIGRVFLLREHGYDYWGLASVQAAERLCRTATRMTRIQFIAYVNEAIRLAKGAQGI